MMSSARPPCSLISKRSFGLGAGFTFHRRPSALLVATLLGLLVSSLAR